MAETRYSGTGLPKGTLLDLLTYKGNEYVSFRMVTDFFASLVSSSKGVAPIFKRSVDIKIEGKKQTMSVTRGLKDAPVTGNETLQGKAEELRAYEASITVQQMKKSVRGLNEWVASDSIIGVDLSNADTLRRALYSFAQNVESQNMFDTMQGFCINTTTQEWDKASNTIVVGAPLNRNTIVQLGFDASSNSRIIGGHLRPSMRPIPMAGATFTEQGKYILLVDDMTAAAYLQSAEYLGLANYDIRGRDMNMIFKNIIGSFGNVIIMHAPISASRINSIRTTGTLATREIGFDMGSLDIEESGLRVRDANGLWTGEKGHDPLQIVAGRGILLGADAIMKIGDAQRVGLQEGQFSEPSVPYIFSLFAQKKTRYTDFTSQNNEINVLSDYEVNLRTVEFVIPAPARIQHDEQQKTIVKARDIRDDMLKHLETKVASQSELIDLMQAEHQVILAHIAKEEDKMGKKATKEAVKKAEEKIKEDIKENAVKIEDKKEGK